MATNHLGSGTSLPAAPQTSTSAPTHVATNADKLALTGLTGGEIVIIDQEGGRVEMYVAGLINDDASWAVLKNTINLFIYNQYADCTVNGVDCPYYTVTNVGWVDPTNISSGLSDAALSTVYYSNYSGYVTQDLLEANISIGRDNGPNEFFIDNPGVFALPYPFPPRQLDVVATFVNGG